MCAAAFAERGDVPMCQLPMGCYIEDVKRRPDSQQLHDQIDAFIQAEGLEMSPAYARMQERILSEAGLLDLDPMTIFEMKKVYAEYMKRPK